MSARVERKVRRLLTEGRVRVLEVERCTGRVSVAGDEDDRVVLVHDGLATCTCPAYLYRRDGSHSRAALLVVGACRQREAAS